MAVFERIFDYLDLKPEIEERPNAVELPSAEARVEFEHVSFRYAKRRLALSDVSFTVAPGEIVALVGPSGAGKTTISYLIPRLFDVTDGAVLLDGIDVRDLTLSGLASNIGMVTQEPFIFHASVRDNIAYAKPEADDAEIFRVLEAANLSELLARLPNRLDTIVGERGHRLSGGERQRRARPRAPRKQPRAPGRDAAPKSH